MSAEDKKKILENKKEKIRQGGGQARIKKQHAKNKKTARERIEYLLDDNTFNELNMFVENRSTSLGMDEKEAPGEGVVVGYGTIADRLVYVYAQDFTVMGGSVGEAHANKISEVMDLAIQNGAPIIGLNDSGGARINEGIDSLNGYGEIFYRNTKASGVVPQITAILGPCAGGAVYSPAITDFIFMVDKTSKMFITGPNVIKSVTGEKVSAEELGGAQTHNKISGVAHFMEPSEESALDNIRKLLTYIPNNYKEEAARIETDDHGGRRTAELKEIVEENPQKAYDVRDVIDVLADQDSFMEVQPYFAQNAVIGFARLNGRSVGIIANQPQHLAGCLNIDASTKIARFIRFLDSFNIPIVSLVDVPGYMPGTEQEYGGVIRHGAKVLYAYSEATVPKITLIMRKAYGGAYIAMGSRSVRADLVYAWPIAEIAVMGPEGAANIIYRKEIAAANEPEKLRQSKIDDYKENFANPYIAAKRGMVNDVIKMEATRAKLINGLEMMVNKRENKQDKKHGNIPL
ncbi:acyl-CoA carboxylase subunit beta [Halanaerobium praevalens]|uniref:Propionyl-CoA carboxylase carboxyltransferase subunit n=1 Tax=Halanaerobium praevalens (strain ATCC 33744 / DSM 2228 / GSL) TaxID=572479 RepID=E3DQL4_HALPG|nr:carboxyl transferase domain-containing protein [Halanaerobium praevalens]ADO77925.1 propionyl-CoA carboxylase carboxyltransferase subunit [Halanaerobium praevalens DSM 2228]